MNTEKRATKGMPVRVMGLIYLTFALSACGVRVEETEDAASTAGQSTATSGSAPTTSGTGTATTSANSAQGEEGTGNVVQLQFSDAYTGYWENETRSASLDTEIVRLSFGERYYHIETFVDQSSSAGTDGLNCYRRNGLSLTNFNGAGLRGAADVDKTVSYREWTLEGSKLQSTIYDENGDVQSNSTGTATFKKVFSGLAPAGLQVCQ